MVVSLDGPCLDSKPWPWRYCVTVHARPAPATQAVRGILAEGRGSWWPHPIFPLQVAPVALHPSSWGALLPRGTCQAPEPWEHDPHLAWGLVGKAPCAPLVAQKRETRAHGQCSFSSGRADSDLRLLGLGQGVWPDGLLGADRHTGKASWQEAGGGRIFATQGASLSYSCGSLGAWRATQRTLNPQCARGPAKMSLPTQAPIGSLILGVFFIIILIMICRMIYIEIWKSEPGSRTRKRDSILAIAAQGIRG